MTLQQATNTMLQQLIKLARPQQWLKNGFIFLPLFFSGQLSNLSNWCAAIIAFVAFCFASSSIYSFNDLLDAEADREHPQKKSRPIASGKIDTKTAYALMLALLCLSVATIVLFAREKCVPLLLTIGAYYLINIAYCVKLKHFAIIDALIIAVGFVLRVVVGGIATSIVVSHWIVLMTFLLALFLAFAKRRDDVVIFQKTGITVRKNTARYNLNFINQVLGIIAAVTIVCYIMYTVSDEVVTRLNNHYVYLTSLFVLAGMLRYLQAALVDEKSESPTQILLKDRFIQACILCWIASFFIIIYT